MLVDLLPDVIQAVILSVDVEDGGAGGHDVYQAIGQVRGQVVLDQGSIGVLPAGAHYEGIVLVDVAVGEERIVELGRPVGRLEREFEALLGVDAGVSPEDGSATVIGESDAFPGQQRDIGLPPPFSPVIGPDIRIMDARGSVLLGPDGFQPVGPVGIDAVPRGEQSAGIADQADDIQHVSFVDDVGVGTDRRSGAVFRIGDGPDDGGFGQEERLFVLGGTAVGNGAVRRIMDFPQGEEFHLQGIDSVILSRCDRGCRSDAGGLVGPSRGNDLAGDEGTAAEGDQAFPFRHPYGAVFQDDVAVRVRQIEPVLAIADREGSPERVRGGGILITCIAIHGQVSARKEDGLVGEVEKGVVLLVGKTESGKVRRLAGRIVELHEIQVSGGGDFAEDDSGPVGFPARGLVSLPARFVVGIAWREVVFGALVHLSGCAYFPDDGLVFLALERVQDVHQPPFSVQQEATGSLREALEAVHQPVFLRAHRAGGEILVLSVHDQPVSSEADGRVGGIAQFKPAVQHPVFRNEHRRR